MMSNWLPSFHIIVPSFLTLKDIFPVLGVGSLYEVCERDCLDRSGACEYVLYCSSGNTPDTHHIRVEGLKFGGLGR